MKSKILIVEDDKSINKMVSESLTKEGYAVTSVFDGEEALKVLDNEKDFDLILLDLMLPKIEGIGYAMIIVLLLKQSGGLSLFYRRDSVPKLLKIVSDLKTTTTVRMSM